MPSTGRTRSGWCSTRCRRCACWRRARCATGARSSRSSSSSLGRKCTVLLLDDRTAEGPDLQLHSIAHGVIASNLKPPAYGQARRQLQVLKFRGSDFASGFHDFTHPSRRHHRVPAPGRLRARRRVRSHADRERRQPSSTRCSAAASSAAPARCWSGRRAAASRRSPCSTPPPRPRAAITRPRSYSTRPGRRCSDAARASASPSARAAARGR